ncbi:MAG: type II toxin-antitoxin system VapC family toxin [Candidatus Binatia bacterium]
MVVVDTNVLVYAADADSPFHGPCRRWLDARRERAEAWYCTWPIVYEFLRVTTHPRVLRHPWKSVEAWAFVTALLETPGLGMLVPTLRHADVAGEVLNSLPHLSGNILYDTHTAILMREHGVRQICTRDTDFHRFPFLEVVDPVAT